MKRCPYNLICYNKNCEIDSFEKCEIFENFLSSENYELCEEFRDGEMVRILRKSNFLENRIDY